MTYKIIITDGLAENGQAYLREFAEVDDRTGISKEELHEIIGEYDAMIVRSRTKVRVDTLLVAQKLKVVGRAGVGVDNIDLDAAKKRGVTVVNSPSATTRAVAELTLGLMLSMARFIPRADSTMKDGQWEKKSLRGTELRDKTLGIIGMGRIGEAVCHLAHAVGMRVIGYDPYLTAEEIRMKRAEPSETVQPIYDQADYLTFHVPLTEETRGIVNTDSFGRMKRGIRIICTARGGVIDETALLEALNSGQVAAAALDVFQTEPPGKTALVAHPNVIATPHVGAQTHEAQSRAAAHISEEVMNALLGKELRWRVV